MSKQVDMVPKGWLNERLEKHIVLISGQHVPVNECSDNKSGRPYLTGPADLLNGDIHASKYTLLPRVICEKGDILVTVKGSGTGTIVQADKSYCISRQLMAIRSISWDSDFTYYILRLNSNQYREKAVGLIPGINRNDILHTQVLIPSVKERRKIVKILRQWETSIKNIAYLIDRKKDFKQALMQKLLTGKRRFKWFSRKAFHKTELGEFLIPSSRPVPRPNSSYTALGIRSHGKGTFLRTVENPESVMMDTLYEVKENDLIVNITFAWEGAIAIVKKSDEGALVSHRFPTHTFNKNIAIPEYFRHVIQAKRFVYELGLASPGGAGRNRVMNKTDFLNIVVSLPSADEQKKIAAVLNGIDKEIGLLAKKLECLKTQKKGLMQKLLTGQIRVKVGNVKSCMKDV